METKEKIKKIKKFRIISKITNEIFVNEAIHEARNILLLSTDNEFYEFCKIYKKYLKRNVFMCGLQVDKIKARLINEGKMTLEVKDRFGRFT